MTEQRQDPKDALEGMIKALALERFGLGIFRQRTATAKDTLETSEAWKDWDAERLLEQLQVRTVSALEAETRTTALEVALELHVKDLQGVTVVARRTFEVTDEAKATAWAKANMPEALVLDHRAFEKMVMARPGGAGGVPGVVYSEEEYGAARIDRDLSRYLAG
jgi:hypothetical protein